MYYIIKITRIYVERSKYFFDASMKGDLKAQHALTSRRESHPVLILNGIRKKGRIIARQHGA